MLFKALEDYLIDYENRLYSDYMRAKKAKSDWLSARREQQTIEIWEAMRNGMLTPDMWRMWMNGCISPNAKEITEEINTFSFKGTAYILTDIIVVDGAEYTTVEAIRIKCDSENGYRVYNSAENSIEKKYDMEHIFYRNREVYEQDIELVWGRSDEWIKERAHKDTEKHRKWIEAKVQKMLGEVTDVWEERADSSWYFKGTNGKTAHMWFIPAGGYNIQRAHVRCIIKEVKDKGAKK